MKIAYTQPRNMRPATKALLATITEVVDSYLEQGYRMTLRQLYYQLVAAGILDNNQKQYSKLSGLLTNARLCGLVDWDIIEDRIRVPQRPAQWDSPREILDSCAAQYRLNRHEGQDNYVEVWCEKDALSGVLLPVTEEYHVHLMVNRGYSSITAMHDAALRFTNTGHMDGEMHIIYLGDFDPSGLDMVRDIQSRLEMFGVYVNVHHIALTRKQIDKYRPPPNPAKIQDSRAAAYITQHGHESWELDALRPGVLQDLLRVHLKRLLDMPKYNKMVKREAEHREYIRALAGRLD